MNLIKTHPLCTGAYFINFLHNYWTTPGVVSPEQLLSESLILDAVALTVHTWAVEQRHEQDSPYRYSELPRKGLGPPVAYTGAPVAGVSVLAMSCTCAVRAVVGLLGGLCSVFHSRRCALHVSSALPPS